MDQSPPVQTRECAISVWVRMNDSMTHSNCVNSDIQSHKDGKKTLI